MIELLGLVKNQTFLMLLVFIVLMTPVYREFLKFNRDKSRDSLERERNFIDAFSANSDAIVKNTAVIASLQKALEKENYLKQQTLDVIIQRIEVLNSKIDLFLS